MEENKDILNGGLEPLSEADVKDAKVENARTRPNSTGLYGSPSLKQEDVKKIFDAYPNKLREKLNDVIAFANALLGILGYGVDGSTITGALNSLSERVGKDDIAEDSRFDSNTLASAILKLSEDLGKTDVAASAERTVVRELIRAGDEELRHKYDQIVKERGVTSVEYDDKSEVIVFTFADGSSTAIDLPVESLVKGLTMDDDGNIVLTLEGDQTVTVSTKVIADAIANEGLRLEGMINKKLDKVVGNGNRRIYGVEPDGTQSLYNVGNGSYDVVRRTSDGNISLPASGPTDSKHAASKQYVDETIASAGGGSSVGKYAIFVKLSPFYSNEVLSGVVFVESYVAPSNEDGLSGYIKYYWEDPNITEYTPCHITYNGVSYRGIAYYEDPVMYYEQYHLLPDDPSESIGIIGNFGSVMVASSFKLN